ncbi:hypothetical protein GCM10017783_07150 [Deinococcus piscis]|uniref:Uncharacterized protein n=1 Tax=Deinococcus piscis TaxID=394230 RepID=A0ABQ3K1C2_9DEIO|nr:hypothetical protein [Deinococcus piscis]GHF97861.1 hypothetical protein GCM10017783_07150 [Deinococcus piscis]
MPVSCRPSAPNDPELLRDFTRLVPVGRSLDGVLWLEVGVVSWPTPHTPQLHWEPLQSLPAHASAQAVTQARHAALHDPRYFALCGRCGQRRPQGWMHDGDLCQSCAERWLGVVH